MQHRSIVPHLHWTRPKQRRALPFNALPPPDLQPNPILRAHRQIGHRHRNAFWDRRKSPFAHEHRQQKRPLDHGEPRAGADAGAGGKGDEGLAQAGLAVLGRPTAGVEAVGVVPEPFMPVQVPR